MRTFLISLGLCLVNMAFGMESLHEQPFGEATRQEFGEKNRNRRFKISDRVDTPSYLTSLGGVVTMNLYHYRNPEFRFLPFVKSDDGKIELLCEANKIVDKDGNFELNTFDLVDLFLADQHKQPYFNGYIFYIHDDQFSCALVDRAAVTFLTQEKDCMPLCKALSGLKYQLENMSFVKSIIPIRKNMLYTNPTEPKSLEVFTREWSFSADTHENREEPVLRIGKVYPFDECMGRLCLNLKGVGRLMMAMKDAVQNLRLQDFEPDEIAE